MARQPSEARDGEEMSESSDTEPPSGVAPGCIADGSTSMLPRRVRYGTMVTLGP